MSLVGSDIAKRLATTDEQERKLAIEKALTLEKAFRSGDVDAIYKAQNYLKQQDWHSLRQPPRADGMKSIILDPLESASSLGYYSKSTNLSYAMLRAMGRTPIVSAVRNTRKDQISEFSKPQANKYSPGFIFEKVGAEDGEELTDRDKRVVEKLTKFILNCGDDDKKWDLDDFSDFIGKIVDDSLILDQATFEIIPKRGGEPTQFVATDGATFRLADSFDNDNNTNGKKKVKGYYPSYVQLYMNQILAEFYPWELCFGIRNPSTNIYTNGYGRSELEDLVQTVTSMLNADKYNSATFTRGSSPKGMLLVKKGGLNNDRIGEVRRDWNAMITGADNNAKTLIMDGESFEWVDLQKNNKDMEYSAFQEYLIKLICAVYKISPEEIGFPLQGSKGGNGIGSKEGGEQEKEYSMSKGLKPLLTKIEGWINKFLIGPKTNEAWRFKFVGMDVESAKEEEERLQKAVTTYITPNEIRKGKKMKPFKESWADKPLNPIIAQQDMMAQQQQMDGQAQQQEEDQADYNNTNPFLNETDEDGKENPFAKAFNDMIETKFITKAA